MQGGTASFEVRLGVAIPMSDGVSLNADLYLPRGIGPQPCLFKMTPYNTDFSYKSAAGFARHGFAVCVVDVRGRGGSGGLVDVYNEGPDGADCVAWIARQPWCDGQVAMFGGSYSGMNQWVVAARRPPALKAIAPLVAPLVGFDADGYRGIMVSFSARWSAMIQGKSLHWRLFEDEDYWRELNTRHWAAGRDINGLAHLTGAHDPLMQTLIDGFDDPEWIARRTPTPEEYAQIDIPVLTATGTAENCQLGAVEYRKRHLAARPGAQHWLMIGPTTHAGLRDVPPSDTAADTPDRHEAEEIEGATVLAFYNWALRGQAFPAFLDAPAKIYLAEAERWCALPEVPRYQDFHPSAGRLLTTASSSPGTTRLQGPPPPPMPTGAASLFMVSAGENALDGWHLTDHSGAQQTFTSDPLPEPMDYLGPARAVLDLTCSHDGLDVMVIVYAILPSGQTRILAADLARIEGREARPLVLDGFHMDGVRLSQGSRLAMQVRILNSPEFQRSPSAIAAIGDEEMVLHEAASVLQLPLYPVGALA
ncbi:MAG: CocE/NonD family hydrolase [Tabrizicola sp.]|nr:CocE/NonD family hydrolase [Tabrizicola sp.]